MISIPGSPTIVIHPGLPKTGTTFLQNRLFDPHPEIAMIGKPFTEAAKSHRLDDACRALSQLSTAGWDKARPLARRHFETALKDPRVFDPEQHSVLLLSHEGLLTPKYGLPAEEVYARVCEVFGEGFRILLTVREQRSWLESFYLFRFTQPVTNPEICLGPRGWLREQRRNDRNLLTALNHETSLGPWLPEEDPDRLLVIPFELIADNRVEDYSVALASFLQIKAAEVETALARDSSAVNARRTDQELALAKVEAMTCYLNMSFLERAFFRWMRARIEKRLGQHGIESPSGLFLGESDLLSKEEIRAYRDSNAALQKRCSWNLTRLGYKFPESPSEPR